MSEKIAYIIAGPNGSGKTTFAKEFLPLYVKCPHFINADLIAQGLSPFFPEKVAIKAGKLVLEQISELVNKEESFAFETTLSGKTYINLFKQLKEKGYKLHVFYLWIPNSQIAIYRIKERVLEGGHNVPVMDIKRRYKRSLLNFFTLFLPLLDSWIFFDNSNLKPKPVAKKINSHIDIINQKLFAKILKQNGVQL